MTIFQTNLDKLFRKRTFEDKWHRFFMGRMSILSPNQQCQSTEENKASTQTSGLTSSFIHPSLVFWWKRCCSPYAIYAKPVPVTKTLNMQIISQRTVVPKSSSEWPSDQRTKCREKDRSRYASRVPAADCHHGGLHRKRARQKRGRRREHSSGKHERGKCQTASVHSKLTTYRPQLHITQTDDISPSVTHHTHSCSAMKVLNTLRLWQQYQNISHV